MEQAIQIVINARDATSNAFNSAKGGLGAFKDKLESMQPAFQRMAVAGTVAFTAISAVVGKGVQDYAEAERAQRQLENAIINVSKGTREQVAEVEKLANAIQKKTGMDGDSIKAGVAQLSTFGLQSKSVIALTKSLADLTVNQDGVNAGADQYISNANTIAKALNGQFGVLEKSGIRFTEYQKKLIETGTEAQKVAAVQEGLQQNLRETTDTVGGADVAMAKFKSSMGDASESIGKAMLPALGSILEKLQPIIEKFTAWAERNPDLFAKIIMVAGAIAGLVAVLGTLGLILPPIIAFFGLLSLPIIGVGLAIAGIIFIIYQVIQIFNMLKNDSDLIWSGIKITAQEKLTALREGIMKIVNAIKEFWITVWTGIRDFFSGIWESIRNMAQNSLNAVKGFLQPIIDMINKVISGLQRIGSAVGNSVGNAVNWVGDKLGINDGIVQNGKIISTHPDDTIVAMKDFGQLGGKGLVLNINGGNYLSESAAYEMGDMILNRLKMELRM